MAENLPGTIHSIVDAMNGGNQDATRALLAAALAQAQPGGRILAVTLMDDLDPLSMHVWTGDAPFMNDLFDAVGPGWDPTPTDLTDFVLAFFGGEVPIRPPEPDERSVLTAPAA